MTRALLLAFALMLGSFAAAQSTDADAQAATGDRPVAKKAESSEADEALTAKVRAKLGDAPAFAGVQVSARKGVVTLEGSIASRKDREAARSLARGVPGVKRVLDRFTMAAAPAPEAPENTAGSIAGNTAAESGTAVGDAADARAGDSTSTAKSTNPGTHPAPAATRRTAPDPFAEDPALVSRIEGALRNEGSLAGQSVALRTTAEGLELSGSVETGKQKVTALRIVQSYAGNRKVSDKITVSKPTRRQPANARTQTPQRQQTPPQGNSAVPK